MPVPIMRDEAGYRAVRDTQLRLPGISGCPTSGSADFRTRPMRVEDGS
jgi:hypothetical protein